MGSPYTSQSASGYNNVPPSDDGTISSSNQITWSKIKTKLSDVIKTLSDGINSQLVTALDQSNTAQSSAYTTTLSDRGKPIQVTGTTTISLGDSSAMGKDYQVAIINSGVAIVTVALITATDTLNGVANGTVKLNPGVSILVCTVTTTNGYLIFSDANQATQSLSSPAGTNTYTATAAPKPGVYTAGQKWQINIPNTNTSGTVTLNISSLGARSVLKRASGGLVALGVGDLVSGNTYILIDDGTQLIVEGVRNYSQGADIASATTINLDTATGDYVNVTGTTTITTITLAKGEARTVQFSGILTLTNGASLILPGGATITTAAGDTAIFRGEASGVVRCITYVKASDAGLGTRTVPFGGTGAATFTAHGVMVGNGTGALAVTAAGSSGQVLTSNGASSDPTYQAIGLGWTFLAALTPTAAANVDALTTFSSSYDSYYFIGEGLLPATSDSLAVRFANSGTADGGSNYYIPTINGATTTTSSTLFILDANSTVLSGGIGINFELLVTNANDATYIKTMFVRSGFQASATPGYESDVRNVCYKATNAVSGVRFFWNSGNNFAAQGKIRIYGVRNS